jgi:hypothetical protein
MYLLATLSVCDKSGCEQTITYISKDGMSIYVWLDILYICFFLSVLVNPKTLPTSK